MVDLPELLGALLSDFDFDVAFVGCERGLKAAFLALVAFSHFRA